MEVAENLHSAATVVEAVDIYDATEEEESMTTDICQRLHEMISADLCNFDSWTAIIDEVERTCKLRRVGRRWDEEIFRIVNRALGGLNVFRYMLKEGNMDKTGSWIAYISSIISGTLLGNDQALGQDSQNLEYEVKDPHG